MENWQKTIRLWYAFFMNQTNAISPDAIPIPTSLSVDQSLLTYSVAAIAAYNASIATTSLLSPEFLLYLLSAKESETSSRIEGTDITFEEMVLSGDGDLSAFPKTERSAKREALGVKHAIERGKKEVGEMGIPISVR